MHLLIPACSLFSSSRSNQRSTETSHAVFVTFRFFVMILSVVMIFPIITTLRVWSQRSISFLSCNIRTLFSLKFLHQFNNKQKLHAFVIIVYYLARLCCPTAVPTLPNLACVVQPWLCFASTRLDSFDLCHCRVDRSIEQQDLSCGWTRTNIIIVLDCPTCND